MTKLQPTRWTYMMSKKYTFVFDTEAQPRLAWLMEFVKIIRGFTILFSNIAIPFFIFCLNWDQDSWFSIAKRALFKRLLSHPARVA